MNRSWRGVVALGVLAALAGCSSNPSDGIVARELLATAAATVKPKAPIAPPRYGRADVDAAGIPLIRVRLPSRSVESVIARRDSRGPVETWATNDGTTISLRDGVLISSRGLSPDLMSAAVPSVGHLRTTGGTHARSYFVLGDADATQRTDYSCVMASLGPQRIEILQRFYATVHMQETCTGSAGKIVNDFWIDGSGRIVKSRQWTNPEIGYTEVERLAD